MPSDEERVDTRLRRYEDDESPARHVIARRLLCASYNHQIIDRGICKQEMDSTAPHARDHEDMARRPNKRNSIHMQQTYSSGTRLVARTEGGVSHFESPLCFRIRRNDGKPPHPSLESAPHPRLASRFVRSDPLHHRHASLLFMHTACRAARVGDRRDRLAAEDVHVSAAELPRRHLPREQHV